MKGYKMDYLRLGQAKMRLLSDYGLNTQEMQTVLKSAFSGKPTRIPRSLDKMVYSYLLQQFYVERSF